MITGESVKIAILPISTAVTITDHSVRIALSPITGKENSLQCESFQSFDGPALAILQVAVFLSQLFAF